MLAFVTNRIKALFKPREQETEISFVDNNQLININEIFTVVTDTASLAIFDVELLKHRVHDHLDWCFDVPFQELQEVISGDCLFIHISENGPYKVRVTNAGLTEDEALFKQKTYHGQVKIVSGQCFIGNGESVPSDNYLPSPQNVDLTAGGFLVLAQGSYDVYIHQLHIPENRYLPNFVILFKLKP